MTADEVKKLLRLEPLASEGGFFRRTYESAAKFSPPGHTGERRHSTAIYYLVTPQSFSSLHRLPQDEIFHFYCGDPVEMLQINERGEKKVVVIGNDLSRGQEPQCVAPGGIWQGTRLVEGGRWALLGTTVAPGFDHADFELMTRAQGKKLFPQHEQWITRFTHS